MLIQRLLDGDVQFYFAVVISVIVSIVLHELAHGLAAIRLGDDTPIVEGRMTGNPLVHMGPFSLVALFAFGIAWGQMPIDRTRLRGRHAEALVSGAGPAMNLALALVATVALGLWYRFGEGVPRGAGPAGSAQFLLYIFGLFNFVLCILNLIPVPPLDGYHIAQDYSRAYREFVNSPTGQGVMTAAFFAVFLLGGTYLFRYAGAAQERLLALVAGA